MGIIRFAIDNPVKIAVGVILLVLFGMRSILSVPVQLTPDVDRPYITVQTDWLGASPQEIETEIIERQEEKLKSTPDLKKMTSSSSENQASITLEFSVGVDKDVALRNVSEKLRQVPSYPEEVDEPIVLARGDPMGMTIAWMILHAKDGSDVAPMKTFIEENVKPQLERAIGIAEVPVYGGRDREIRIEIDPYKIAALGLTLRDVEAALRAQNRNSSAGTIEQGKREINYRTVGEYQTTAEIEKTVIAYRSGGPVTVADVGTVIDGLAKQRAFVRSKGLNVIAMPAVRESGANVLEAMDSLRERVDYVNKEILEPRGMILEQVYDETDYIHGSIQLVLVNILVGGLLAVVVLMLFLRSVSATGVVALSIPISVVGTFLVVTALGRSLNVVMLAGMAFAVGMVVDNAIVVLENIYRHRAMGASRKQAAFEGAREVWGAVLASTLTTMAVFLPVIFIEEEAGQLFKDIAIAISSAVALSLIVSVLVIPTVAGRVLHASKRHQGEDRESGRFGALVGQLTSKINGSTPVRLAVVIGLSLSATLGSLLLLPATEYLPAGNKNLIFGMILCPAGYGVSEYRHMAHIVEEGDPDDPYDGLRVSWEAELGSKEAELLPDVDIPVGLTGERIVTIKPPPVKNFFYVTWNGSVFMGCTSKDPKLVTPLEAMMNREGRRIPGAFAFFEQESLFQDHRASGIVLEVRGDDLDKVTSSATALMGALYQSPNILRVQPDPANFALGRPEVQLFIDHTKASDLGMDIADISFIVEACVDGAFVGEFNDHGDRIDMRLQFSGLDRATTELVTTVPIYTPRGDVVPLANVVKTELTTAPQKINHIEEMAAIALQPTPRTGIPLQETMREIEEDIIAPLRASGAIPDGVSTVLAGTADKLTQTQRALVGDFEGAVQRPRLAGLSVTTSVAILLLLVGMAALWISVIAKRRTGLLVGVAGVLGVGVLVLVLNPALPIGITQSGAILALIITYLLMAALFESFAYPFVIMLSVPLAAVGGVVGIRIVSEFSLYDVTTPIQQLDVLAMLGFVILIGIVVNNAILIVHQALNYMREQGLAPHAAVVKSVETRTRPIFMSALTSIFGMTPLVVMTGPGSELYRGLGSVVLGGLLVSTVFTLVVVPAMFTLFLDARAWIMGASPEQPTTTGKQSEA